MPAMAFFSIDEAFVCQEEVNVIIDATGSFNETKFRIEVCSANQSTGLCVGPLYSTGWINGEINIYDLSEEIVFEGDTYYKINLRVDNDACERESIFEELIFVKTCSHPPGVFEFEISNPRHHTLEFDYTVGISGTLSCALINATTGHTTVVIPQLSITPGTYSHSSSISHLPSGAYYLLGYLNGIIAQASVIKI